MLDNIGFPAITEERANNVSEFSPLQRCELIITKACNLKCVYCNSLTEEYGKTISKFDAYQIIDGWIEHKLQHASFSGGEPMCSPHIRDYVKRLHNGGVPFISLSTNGTFPINDYEMLVKSGATHFSISIDGMNSVVGDRMSGVSGAWEKAIESIKFLSKCSYVTASTVFNRDNWEQAPEIIEFIHSLGVADIRFSTATQFNKLVPKLEIIPKEILNKHPILKYRVANLIKGINMRGANPTKRCWLPMDDMVISGTLHFPCTMACREVGGYIGSILENDGSNKTMNKIRAERANWVQQHDCSKDSICQKYCMDFIMAHNLAVDKRLGK